MKEGTAPPPVALDASTMYGNIWEMAERVSVEVYTGIFVWIGSRWSLRVRDLAVSKVRLHGGNLRSSRPKQASAWSWERSKA